MSYTPPDPHGITAKYPHLEVRIERREGIPKLVTFGAGGSTVYYGRPPEVPGQGYQMGASQLQGYEKPETFFAVSKWWAHDYLTATDPAQYEGVPFVDMRAAVNQSAGFRMALHGPMVDVDLADEAVKECPQPSDLFASAMLTQGGEFGSLLVMQAVAKATDRQAPGPLDAVSVKEFLRRWKEAGAPVGYIESGEFRAEEGCPTICPKCGENGCEEGFDTCPECAQV